MFQLFLDWIQVPVNFVSDDLLFIFCSIAALIILLFIIDLIKYILYYICR